jgi:aspartate-semialdehyde dehydrogenase
MIDVGILGATGAVGQQLISLLNGHPWFRVSWLGASQRSEGKAYRDATVWRLRTELPERVARLTVDTAAPENAPDVVFSGLDAGVAGEIEQAFARSGRIIISNSRNHRMDPAVPLLIPEINADHAQLLATQRMVRGWPGLIVTNPNCSTIVLALALAPLRPFGITHVSAATYQAISGAGYPGVASWDILGNVVPFIGGEEEKIETEPKKILGTFRGGEIEPHPMVISAQATRVPVQDGHTVAVSVRLAEPASVDVLVDAFESFRGRPQELELPSAPKAPVIYLRERDRPQPALDVTRDAGMAVTIGRLRPCSVMTHKFVALGHNTIRGAAGAAILNAELLHQDDVF